LSRVFDNKVIGWGRSSMGWDDFIEIIRWLPGLWLLLIIALVVVRVLSGSILLTGLLRLENKMPFGFDRLQLLAVTLLFAAGYIIAALAKGPGDALPRIPTPLLLILVGSNGAYVASKFAALRGSLGRGN
jgi:hypothetical protein